jgi:hypothetical protein
MGRDIISKLLEDSGDKNAPLTFLEGTHQGVIFSVRLQPRAAKNQFAGVMGDALKVKVTAAPVEGAANDALCEFFAQVFGIAKKRVRIISGLHSRQKRVLLMGLDKEFASVRMGELSQSKG